MIKRYDERLPRGVRYKKLRCQALTRDGALCGKRAVYEITLSGDPEWPDDKLAWAAIVVCEEHMPDFEMDAFLKSVAGGRR